LEAAGFLNEGMIVYKVLKVLKADSRYTTWVDIVRARGQLPTFNDLADEARELFAAEIVQEQNHVFSVEGALRADEISENRTRSDACYYCGYRGNEKKDCRFFKRDSEKGELKPQGWYKTNHF
jgi:alkylated DNA nucleotide flippase Atl1